MAKPGDEFLRAQGLSWLNRLKRMRSGRMTEPIVKSADARSPMLSQAGNILRQAGILQEKPATIVKRVIAKGKVLEENVGKLSAAPPTSSYSKAPAKKQGKLDIPQDDTNPKLAFARAFLKEAISAKLPIGAIHGRQIRRIEAHGVVPPGQVKEIRGEMEHAVQAASPAPLVGEARKVLRQRIRDVQAAHPKPKGGWA